MSGAPRVTLLRDGYAMRDRIHFHALRVLLGCAVLLGGCGRSGHGRTEVTGLVTLNGKPLPGGLTIKFTPQESGMPVASGWTNPDSTYAIYAEPGKIGLNPGTYIVSVELPYADEPGPYTGPPELENIEIPKAFQTGISTHTFTVPADGSTFDIVMKGE
jgi:hypothetical protein